MHTFIFQKIVGSPFWKGRAGKGKQYLYSSRPKQNQSGVTIRGIYLIFVHFLSLIYLWQTVCHWFILGLSTPGDSLKLFNSIPFIFRSTCTGYLLRIYLFRITDRHHSKTLKGTFLRIPDRHHSKTLKNTWFHVELQGVQLFRTRVLAWMDSRVNDIICPHNSSSVLKQVSPLM